MYGDGDPDDGLGAFVQRRRSDQTIVGRLYHQLAAPNLFIFSICLFVCLSVFCICLFVFLYVCMFVCLYVCLFVIFVCLSAK